jgi:hypothetical protein
MIPYVFCIVHYEIEEAFKASLQSAPAKFPRVSLPRSTGIKHWVIYLENIVIPAAAAAPSSRAET